MATRTDESLRKCAGSPATPTEDAGVESPRRIHGFVCRTGVVERYMCGPRVRGRCRSCWNRVRVSLVLHVAGLVSMVQ